jgi:hypothetical protein
MWMIEHHESTELIADSDALCRLDDAARISRQDQEVTPLMTSRTEGYFA